MNTLRAFLATLAVIPALQAQVATQIWATRYNGPTGADDLANSVAVDSADNVVVTGYSAGANANPNFYTAKYAAADGSLLWEERYSGPGNGISVATGIAVDKSNNVIVTGYSFGTSNYDYYTAKYAAADGALLWEKRYNGPGDGPDLANSIVVDSTGNVIVTGYSTGASGNYDYYTIKYASANGARLWETRYNGPSDHDDKAASVAVDGQDNVIVTGSSSSGALTDFYTAKYSAAEGTVIWEKRYSGVANSFNSAVSVAVDAAGNVAVTGSTTANNNYDYYTAKYAAADGALLWEKRYDGPAQGNDQPNSVAVDPSGNVIVTGSSIGNGSNTDYYTAKYAAANGALLWERRYNGPGNGVDVAASVLTDKAGNVAVTGYSTGTVGGTDYYTTTYAAADGKTLSAVRYNFTANRSEVMIGAGQHYLALTSDGSPVVTGASTGASSYDYATVRYGPPDTTTLLPTLTTPADGALVKNPISVAFTLPEDAAPGTVTLTFTGATTTVLTLANTQDAQGTHSFTFNPANPKADTSKIVAGNGIPDGIYTVTLSYQDVLSNGVASDSSTAVKIDTTPPTTTINSGPGQSVFSPSATFTLSSDEQGATFQASLDGAAYATVTSPVTYNGLFAGNHTFSVRAIDPAGNVDPQAATRTWTVLPPGTSIDSGPTGPVQSTVATFTFSSNELGVTFKAALDNGIMKAVTGSATFTGLTAGPHTFKVQAFDSAGNFDKQNGPATRTWTVLPPNTTIDSGPSGPVLSTVATFTFSSDVPGATFQAALDGGNFATATSPATYSGLAAGPHTFKVRALDAANNPDPTPATQIWTVLPPDTTITSGPNGPVLSPVATFKFTSDLPGATFQAALDSGAFVAATSPLTYTGLAAGSHTIQVRAVDDAGNPDPTPATRTWTVLPPDTTIDSGPSGVLNNTQVSFSFSSNEADATFLATLDGAPEVTVTSPHTYTDLTAGQHTLSLRAVDSAGNPDPTPATRTWTILFTPAHEAHYTRDDLVPGAGNGIIPPGAVWADFGVPAINSSGALAVRAKFSSPAGSSWGIFVDDTLVAMTGDSTPELGPATFASFSDPVFDDAGHVAFTATVAGNSVTPARDTVLVTNAFGPLAVVARESAVTAGASSPRLKAFQSISLVDGELLFTAKLQGGVPLVTTANDLAAYRITQPGALGHVVRTGDPLLTTTITRFQLLGAVPGSPGQDRGHAPGIATFLAFLADGTRAIVTSSSGIITPVLLPGDPTGSATLPGTTFQNFRTPMVDGNHLAFLGKLKAGIDGLAPGNQLGIFLGYPSQLEPIARLGQSSTLLSTTFASFQDPVLAPGADGLAFIATLHSPSAASIQALFYQGPGLPLGHLAYQGGRVDSTPEGARWATFTSLALPGLTHTTGAQRGPIFTATLQHGPGGINATNDTGVWAGDTSRQLPLLFRTGDLIDGKTLRTFTVLNPVPGSPGVTRSFNDNGQLTWRATFTDGTTAILITQIP